jgi:hypothetical protein
MNCPALYDMLDYLKSSSDQTDEIIVQTVMEDEDD